MKKKVLVIAEFPAPYRIGVFKKLAEQYDLDVFFNACENENRNPAWFCKSGEFSFEVLNNKDSNKKFNNALKNICDYDFVLAYNSVVLPSIRAIIRCKAHNVPYFVNNDGAFLTKGNFIKNTIKRFIYNGAALCFSSGKTSEEYFLSYGVKKDNIRIHNFTSLNEEDIIKECISEEEKRTLREELGLENSKIYFVSVGQFIHRKGFDILLEAWKKLENSTNAELLIIGGGDKRPEYESYIKNNKISNISIIDFVEKAVLFKYYKASDIFVFPTREDIWGLVINESMACGLPIISSDMCIAARELIAHGENGFIYSVNNTEELAKYIQKLVDNDILRINISKNNIKKIQGNTIENIGKKHITDIEKWFKENEL